VPDWLAANRQVLAHEGHAVPPAEIRRLVEQPWHLNVGVSQVSPTRTHFLHEQVEEFPPIAALGKAHTYFGGLDLDTRANRSRNLTTRPGLAFQIVDAATGKSVTIAAPPGATLSSPSWSPDGQHLAYLANFDDASHIYVANAASGQGTRLTTTPVLATLVTTPQWTGDSRSIVTVLIPANRRPEPQRPAVSGAPLVRLWTDGVKTPERNHWSLLQDPIEMDQLEYYGTGQLALIDARTRRVTRIGAPAMIRGVDPSPDGQHFRVTTVQKPFSYVVPFSSFATTEEIWDASGKVLAEIVKRPVRLASDTTGGGGGFGPRSSDSDARRGLNWMPQGAGLYYLDNVPAAARGEDTTGAAPGGRSAANRPSRVMRWLPPYGPNDTATLYTNDARIASVAFSDDARTLFVAQTRNEAGEIFAVDLGAPTVKRTIVRPMRAWTPAFTLGRRANRGIGSFLGDPGSPGDSLAFYQNPGMLVTRTGSRGGQVVMGAENGVVYLQGTQYFREPLRQSPRDFVDRVELASGAKTRVFEGANDGMAEWIEFTPDADFSRVVVTRESPTQIAQVYLRDRNGGATKLTDNKDYTPEFTNAVRRRIVATRADGISFVVNVTLPAGYQPGTRLPGMLWFYPREYTDQAAYDRTLRAENVNAYPARHMNPRPIEYLTTLGYAVANFNPPIVGPAGRMNDNYIADLRMNLAAVIDELDKQGFIDRARLGLGGHSYGAFSTMNALAHTPFFKAGIAGDGMYNRTLTPNAFQSERRDFWTAQQTYTEMSPFFYADQIQGAVLMYHSLEDTNVGTDAISAIRMMQALRAHGKKAALYLYPYEGHQPAAKETELDQWARWTAWLDIYVKNAGQPTTVVP
jgi:dipeptidyl aminopeptidase/acylaminoacyl peptidase